MAGELDAFVFQSRRAAEVLATDLGVAVERVRTSVSKFLPAGLTRVDLARYGVGPPPADLRCVQ